MISLGKKGDGHVVQLFEPTTSEILGLPSRLRAALSENGAGSRIAERLFPRAYEDPARDAEYKRLAGDELLQRKLENIRIFEASLARQKAIKVKRREGVEVELHAGELEQWVGVLNDLRLVLGTKLDVQEDDQWPGVPPGHPDHEDWSLYCWLGELEEFLVRALASALP